MKVDFGSPVVQIGLAIFGGALAGFVIGVVEIRPQNSK